MLISVTLRDRHRSELAHPGPAADDRREPALVRLAQLDSLPRPRGRCWSPSARARSTRRSRSTTGEAIADPFSRTAELVELLRCHAARSARTRRAADRRAARPRRSRRARPSPGAAHERAADHPPRAPPRRPRPDHRPPRRASTCPSTASIRPSRPTSPRASPPPASAASRASARGSGSSRSTAATPAASRSPTRATGSGPCAGWCSTRSLRGQRARPAADRRGARDSGVARLREDRASRPSASCAPPGTSTARTGSRCVWEETAPRWGRERITYQRYELNFQVRAQTSSPPSTGSSERPFSVSA